MKSAILVALLLVSVPASAKLNVVTTTTDLAAIVREVGGEHVSVEALCRGYQDPHYLEAKPSHMARLRSADLMVYVGLELEVGWLPLLISGARNPDLRDGEPGSLNASAHIGVVGVPTGEVSRSEGDVHPLGNPHYWLDPRNQLVMAATIADRLARLDRANAVDYQSNLQAFRDRMEDAIADWERRLAPWRGRQIVCYHQQWEYLLGWIGIEVLDYIENKPGIPPSPQHISQLREAMEREHVALVLISNFFEPAAARRVAERAGADLLILPPSVEGEDGLDTPFAHFEYLVSQLESAVPSGGAGE
jgi:zinc/manganese transport system substrate-binding protein